MQYKPPRTGGTTHWHQDAPARPVITPDVQVTAWVALDDQVQDGRQLTGDAFPQVYPVPS